MARSKKAKTPSEPNILITSLIGGGIGLAVTIALAFLLPLAMLSAGDPNTLALPASALCIFTGGLTGAVITSKKCKKMPIQSGLLVGGIMLLPMLLVSIFINGEFRFVNAAVLTAVLISAVLIGSVINAKMASSGKRNMKKALKRR